MSTRQLFKIIALLIVLISIATIYSNARTKQYNMSADLDGQRRMDSYFWDVRIECDSPEVCWLYCYGLGGPTRCNFLDALENCGDCGDSFYSEAHGDEMHDHAIDEINDDNIEGSYNSNIIIDGDRLIYRTVDWTVDTLSNRATINVTISEND